MSELRELSIKIESGEGLTAGEARRLVALVRRGTLEEAAGIVLAGDIRIVQHDLEVTVGDMEEETCACIYATLTEMARRVAMQPPDAVAVPAVNRHYEALRNSRPDNAVTALTRAAGRDYITPEDVGDALRTAPADTVRSAVLEVLGKQTGYGVEDPSLCAFIAWSGNAGHGAAAE